MQPTPTRSLPFTREADFRQERDFGAKINATFGFIGANFRPLVKTLAYFVLPGALVAGIGMGTFTNTIWNRLPASGARRAVVAQTPFDGLTGTLLGSMGVGALALMVSFLLIVGALYSFVRVRMAVPAAEAVQPGQVWAFMRPRLGRMLLAVVVLAAIGGTAAAALVGAVSALTLSPVASFFGLLALFVLGIWLSVIVPLVFPILWLEDAPIGLALQRAFFLVRGKWWSTFGLLFISSIIQGFAAFVFIIPQYAVMFGKILKIPFLDSDVLGIAGNCIYTLGTLFTYAIPLLALMFQYFNLVERHEGTGSLQLLQQLGQAPGPGAAGAAYGLSEEGEY